MKSNKKLIIVILASLVSLLVCAGVIIGVQYFGNNEEIVEVEKPKRPSVHKPTTSTKNKYTVMVKDNAGNPVKGVLVAFYDQDKNMITKPTATNSVGSAVYTVKEEGSYGVGILSVPFRYTLDSKIMNFSETEKTIQVVLNDNPNAYVAQINGVKYLLEDAVKVANSATEDVVITLVGDVRITSLTFNNANGKKITLDGKGHTLTTFGGGNALHVSQKSGTIAIKNLIIDHKNSGQAIKMNTAVTLNLENIKMYATHDQEDAYKYCLINFMGEGTSNLYMNKVDVVMATTSKGSSAGVIRTGNSDTPKHVNITMKNCNIDVTEAAGRCGIIVMANCTSNINLSGTTIMTKNTYAIRPNGQPLTYTDDCVFGSKDEWYNAHPIEMTNAMIGDKRYTLQSAISFANSSEEDVTIKLVGDVALKGYVSIKNKAGKNITLDGGGYTLEIQGGSHSLQIDQPSGTVTIQNLKIDHSGSAMVLRIGQNREAKNYEEKTTVNLINLDIASTSTYKYCLMATQDYKTFHVNMTNVNVDWDTEEKGNTQSAFLRVSNAKYEQQLHMNMTDCVIDVSGAVGRKGIYVTNNATGEINLYNTSIITQGEEAVYKNKITFTSDEKSAFNCDGGKQHAKIGDVTYLTLANALAVANASEEDVTIELLNDITILGSVVINNVNGKNITIDGCGHTLNADATAHSLLIHQSSGAVTIKNVDIAHSGKNMLMRIGDNVWDDEITYNVTVNLNGVDITSTSSYAWCLIGTQDPGTFNVNMTDVTVDWDETKNTQTQRAFIRCGGNANYKHELNLNMNGSRIDVSGAALTQGMNITKGVTGKINLENTDIITLGANTYTNSGSVTITADEKCAFNSDGGKEHAKIGDVTYLTLAKALAVANDSKDDVTIELINDISIIGSVVINNVNGKNITIDGCGHTLSLDSTAHSLLVHQSSGSVTIQNVDINHTGKNMLMRIGDNVWTDGTTYDVTVNFNGVDIKSTSSYAWCLIGTQDPGTFNMNMKDVTVEWNEAANTQGQRAFIRCGGGSKDKLQTVHIDMTDCMIDVSNAAKAQGMNITTGVSGEINLHSTYIITLKANTYTNSGNVTINADENCVFNTDGSTLVKIGEDIYLSLASALEVANASTEDVTIELLGDMSITSAVTINNVNGKNITIDGGDHTLSVTSNSGHSILMHQSSGVVTIKNLNIIQSGKYMLMRMGDNNWTDGITYDVTVNLENIDITSTSTYAYCLIGTQDPGTFNINMKDVNLDWNETANTQAQRAFIRCGGGSADKAQTVNIDMTDCLIEVTGAAKTQGMYVTAGVSGVINCKNTDIITAKANTYTISDKAAVTINADADCVFDTDGAPPVKIGDNGYETLEDALTVANASTEDVTIELLKDISITGSITINNVNGKTITIDGGGYTLNADATAHSILIHQSNGTVTFKNLDINHSGKNMLMRIGDNVWDDDITYNVTVNLDSVNIKSTSSYQWCLIGTQDPGTMNLNMTNTTVDWDKTGTQAQSAFIRCGGASASKQQTVNLKMTKCAIDVSGAALTQGMYITQGATLNVTRDNSTTITTAKGVDEYTNKGNVKIDADTANSVMAVLRNLFQK